MTAKESLLTLVIFNLLFLIILLICFERIDRKNNEIRLEKLNQEIVLIKEKDKIQDSAITNIIQTEAMKGMFDKKEIAK
jgi:hypothetical protein